MREQPGKDGWEVWLWRRGEEGPDSGKGGCAGRTTSECGGARLVELHVVGFLARPSVKELAERGGRKAAVQPSPCCAAYLLAGGKVVFPQVRAPPRRPVSSYDLFGRRTLRQAQRLTFGRFSAALRRVALSEVRLVLALVNRLLRSCG